MRLTKVGTKGLRGHGRRLTTAFVAALALAAVAAGSGAGASKAVDLEVGIGFRAPGASTFKPVANGTSAQVPTTHFFLVATLENRGADPSKAAVRVELGAGLSWGLSRDPSACTGPPDVICTPSADLASGVRTGWEWNVVADAPGSYAVDASLVSAPAADGNPSNNRSAVTLDVQGAGGSGGVSAVTASKARISPAKPVAGRAVVVTVSFTPTVKPSSVSCAAKVASLAVKGKGTRAAGKAVCRFVPPAAAKGKTLRGTVTAKAAGRTFRRAFGIVLR